MAPRLQQRPGIPLVLNQQEIQFSRWPTKPKQGIYIPQREILTKNPWEAIENAINAKLDRRTKTQDLCLSFLYQALDFYRAYETARISSRPLLLYYALLNLAKTFVIFKGIATDLENAGHGLLENRGSYKRAVITARPDESKRRSIYDLFSRALGNGGLTSELKFSLLKDLIPQIVIGHRLWADATGRKECFVRAENIAFLHQERNKTIWISIDVKQSDLRALGVDAEKFLKYSGLAGFRSVAPRPIDSKDQAYVERIHRLEQTVPAAYVSTPCDVLHTLPAVIGNRMWCIMRTVPAYRRYYFWAAKELANSTVAPLLSVYLVIFYLGSVTRYRPNYFEDLQSSPFGNLFDEIIQTQGQQMLFHLASEFHQRDISWPAVL